MSGLDLWKEGETKQTIVDFVEGVRAEGSESFVSPDDRVAVLDNDRTLWCDGSAGPVPNDWSRVFEDG